MACLLLVALVNPAPFCFSRCARWYPRPCMTQEFVERIISTFGLPTLIVIFIGWFIATKWFPWWASRQETVMRELVHAIHALREESRATAETLRMLAQRVEQLEKSVRSNSKHKRRSDEHAGRINQRDHDLGA